MEDSSDESETMAAGMPAGFFSTFSIADPDGSTREGLGRTQRRNRRVFVCIPCHRRKLKCDKSQPCTRCVASGSPDECVYQQFPSQKHEAEPSPTPRQVTRQATPEASRSEPQVRLEGATHWRSAASEVSLVPIAFICTPTYPAEELTGNAPQFKWAWTMVGADGRATV